MASSLNRVGRWISLVVALRVVARLSARAFAAHCAAVPLFRFLPPECELLVLLVSLDLSITKFARRCAEHLVSSIL